MRHYIAVAMLACPTIASAQIAEKVDPVTGNYVPVRDPFLRDDPDPDKPNPNRLGNRQSKRNNVDAAPSATVGQSADDGLTPAQRWAKGAANNGQAAPPVTLLQNADGSAQSFTADGFVSMGGMATYKPPGASTPDTDPLAKPDWWPQ